MPRGAVGPQACAGNNGDCRGVEAAGEGVVAGGCAASPAPRGPPPGSVGCGSGARRGAASPAGFWGGFGRELPTVPCCSGVWLGGCQNLQVPGATSPSVPQLPPPPRCHAGCQSTLGCLREVSAALPSDHISLGPFAPRSTQTLPGGAVSLPKHRGGPAAPWVGRGPQNPSAPVTCGPVMGRGGRAARLDPVPWDETQAPSAPSPNYHRGAEGEAAGGSGDGGDRTAPGAGDGQRQGGQGRL